MLIFFTEKVRFYLYVHVYKKDSFLVSSTCLVKILQRLSYSFLSITLSCNDFLFNFSKDLIVFWRFSYCFLYFLYLFMILSYITLLPIDNPHVVAVIIGIAIKPIPVRLKVIELDVVATITMLSKNFNIVVKVLYFLCFC